MMTFIVYIIPLGNSVYKNGKKHLMKKLLKKDFHKICFFLRLDGSIIKYHDKNILCRRNEEMVYTEQNLVRIAKRENNPKRTYLVVNRLQGKHIPVKPHDALAMLSLIHI